MKEFINRLKESLFSMIFFAALFSVLGYYIPRAYYSWFDQTIYYSIETPIQVEKEVYKPGDIVTVNIIRKAVLDTQGISIRELNLVDEKGNIEVFTYNTNLAINAGKENIKVDWLLPPNLKDGVYFFQGIVSYPIRGITKYTPFCTERFTVKN